MARATYVLRDGELVEKHLATPLNDKHAGGPNVRSDGMDPIESMADGKIYDSRSAYYASVRAAGCEIIGNEKLPPRREYQPPSARDAIQRARARLGML